MKIVVDTNLLIDFSRSKIVDNKSSLWLKLLKYCKEEGHQIVLPSVVVFELFSGKEMDKQPNREKAENLLKDVTILDVDKEIAQKSAEFFRKYEKNIEVLDFFIAAATINTDGELATLNPKHFEVFDGLKLFDLNKLD